MVHSVWRKLISSWSVSTMYCYCRYCYLLGVVCNFSFFLFGLSAFWKQYFFFSWRVWPWRKCVMTFVQFGFQIFFSFHFGGSVIISLFCNFFIDCLELFVYICDGFILILRFWIFYIFIYLFVKPLIYYSSLS